MPKGQKIEFPTYIPEPVQNHYIKIMPLLNSILEQPNSAAPQEVRTFNKNRTDDSYSDSLPSSIEDHYASIVDRWNLKDELERQQKALSRFIFDDRMQEAYSLLHAEYSKENSWHRFVWAATTANLNFENYRNSANEASSLCAEISATAEHLARLLEYSYFDTEVQIPAFDALSILLSDDLEMEPEDLPVVLSVCPVYEIIDHLSDVARETALSISARKNSGKKYDWGISHFHRNKPANLLVLSAIKNRDRKSVV